MLPIESSPERRYQVYQEYQLESLQIPEEVFGEEVLADEEDSHYSSSNQVLPDDFGCDGGEYSVFAASSSSDSDDSDSDEKEFDFE